MKLNSLSHATPDRGGQGSSSPTVVFLPPSSFPCQSCPGRRDPYHERGKENEGSNSLPAHILVVQGEKEKEEEEAEKTLKKKGNKSLGRDGSSSLQPRLLTDLSFSFFSHSHQTAYQGRRGVQEEEERGVGSHLSLRETTHEESQEKEEEKEGVVGETYGKEEEEEGGYYGDEENVFPGKSRTEEREKLDGGHECMKEVMARDRSGDVSSFIKEISQSLLSKVFSSSHQQLSCSHSSYSSSSTSSSSSSFSLLPSRRRDRNLGQAEETKTDKKDSDQEEEEEVKMGHHDKTKKTEKERGATEKMEEGEKEEGRKKHEEFSVNISACQDLGESFKEEKEQGYISICCTRFPYVCTPQVTHQTIEALYRLQAYPYQLAGIHWMSLLCRRSSRHPHHHLSSFSSSSSSSFVSSSSSSSLASSSSPLQRQIGGFVLADEPGMGSSVQVAMFLSLAYQMKVLRKPSLLIVCEDKDDSHGACRDEKEEEENKVHRERFSRSLKERRRRKGGEDKQDVVSSLQFSRKRQRREGNDDEEKKNRVEESPEKKQNDERGEKKKDTSEGVYTPEKKRSCSESSPVSLHNKEHHHNPMSSSSFSSSSSSFSSSSSSSSSSFSFSSSSSCRGRHWMRIFRRWAPSLFVRWFLDDCVCLLPNSSSSSSSLTRSFSSSPPSEVFQRKTHFLSSPPFPDQERDQDSSTQKGTKDDDDDKKKKSDSRSSREREEEAEEREKEAGVEEEKKSEKCLNGGSEREERGKQEETVSTVGKEEEKQKKKKRNDVGMNRRTADILLITYKDFVKYADAIERSIYTSNGLSFAIFDTRHPYSTSSASCSCSASPSSSSSSSSIHEADTFLCHEESLLYGIAETIDSFVFQIPHGERGRRRRKGEKEQQEEEEERATAKTDERRDLSCDLLPQKLLITNCDPSLCFNTLRRLLPLLLPSIFPSLKHVDLHLSKLTSSPSISSSSASLFSPPLALSSSSSHSSSSSMAVQENNDGHDNVREDERTASVIVKEEEEKKKRERERRRGGGAFLSFLRSYVYPLILRRTRERCLYSLLPDIEGEVQLLSLQNGQSEKSLRLSPSSSSSLFLSQTERLYLQLHAVGKQKLYECIMKINTAGENDEKKRRKKEEEEEKKKKKKVQQEECRRDERDEGEEEKGKKKEDRVDEEEEEERLRSLCVQEHARDMIRNLLLFTIHPMLVSKDLISSSLSLMRQDEKGKKEKNKEDGRLGCLEKEREEEEEEDLLIKRVSTALSEILRVSSFSFPSSSSFRHLPSRTSSSHASQGCSLPCLHTRKSSLQQQKSTLLCLSRSPGACTDSNDRNATAHLMNSMEKERREEEEEEERRRGIEEEEEECKIVCSYCLASSDGKRRIERILKTHFNTWQIRRLAGLLGVSPWYLSKEEINQSAKIKWLVDFLRESSSKTRLEKSSSSSNSSSSFSKFMSSRHPYLQQGRVQEPTFPEDSHQQNSAEDISTTTKRDEEEEEEEEKKKNEKKEKRKTVSMKDDEGPVVVEEEEKENCMDKTHTSGFDKNTIGAARSTSSRCANVDSLHKKKNHRSTVERGMEERVRGKEGERRGEGEEEEDRKEEREKFSGWSGHGRKVVILNPLCEGGRMDRRDRRRGRREVEDKRRRKDRNREQEEDEEKGDEELYERLRMGGRENEGSVASFLQAALGKLIFAISPGVSTAEAGQILHHFLKEDSANVPALLIEDLSSLFYLRPHALSHITDLIWLSFPPTARSIVFPSSSSFCSPFELSSSFSGEFVLLQPALVSHQQQPMQKKAKVERPLATSLDTSTGRILSRREDEDLQGEERSSNAEADSCRRSPVNRSLLNVAADHPRHSTRIQSNREGDRKAQEGLVVRGVGEEEEDLLKNGEEEKKEEERGRCCLKVGRIEEERKEETLVTGKDKMEVQENERKIFHEEEDEEEFLAIREDMRRVESYFKCVGGHALLGDQKKLSVYYLCCEKTMDEVCLRPISQLQANHVS